MRLLRTLVALLVFVAVTAAPARPQTTPAAPAADGSTYVDAARAKLVAGDLQGALEILVPYVAQHPRDVTAGRLLGDVYFRIPDYRRAEQAWRAVVDADPTDKPTHNRLGALYAAEDRIPDAIAEFQKSLPSEAGYAGLVSAHQRAGDLQIWIGGLEDTVARNPLNADAWSLLGHVREDLHQPDRALIAYKHASGLQPESCGSRVDLANALVALEQVDASMDELRVCLAHQPTYYPAVVDMGEAYLEKNDLTRGSSYLAQALELRPNGFEALVDTGYVLDAHGDWKAAISYYNRALAADPMRPEAYINLGYDYAGQRLFTLAEAAYLKGLSIAADNGRLHYLLAVTYDEQGKLGLAREQYRAAVNSSEQRVARAAQDELHLLPPP
ncbi:MAG: tetratricopeptide repeat protein [Vulcanimicrobiaceae bacterium]|jgi:tetratricopeptide (TPR) repeat protein